MPVALAEPVLDRIDYPGTEGHCGIWGTTVSFTGFPSYPFIDRSEREDKELGELHTNPTSWDSNPGLRIQG